MLLRKLTYFCSKVIVATLKTFQGSTSNIQNNEEITHCMEALVGSVSSQDSFTSRTISSIHLRSAGVRATNRSSLAFRNSRVATSVYEKVKRWLRIEWNHTLTSRSISLCCVTIELVLPQSQLWESVKRSSCCNGRYGWKKAS